MGQKTKNILIVLVATLAVFEIGFQPIPLDVKAKPVQAEQAEGYVRTVEYEFENNLVGILSEEPADQTAEKTGEKAESDQAKEKAEPKSLTRDDLVKEVRAVAESVGALVEDAPDAISLPSDKRVAIQLRLPPVRKGTGPLVPDEAKYEGWHRTVFDALNAKYSARAGVAKDVPKNEPTAAKEEEADLLLQVGFLKIERPRPRMKLGLDLQGGVRTVLECVPVSTFRYLQEAPAEEAGAAAAKASGEAEAGASGEPSATDQEKKNWQRIADAVAEALRATGAIVDSATGLERGIGFTVRSHGKDESDGYQATIDQTLATLSPGLVLHERSDVMVDKNTIHTVREVVQRRVDGMGLTEPVIQTEGEDRLIVEIPGQQPEEDIIKPADLKFVQADLNKYSFSQEKTTLPGGRTVEKVIVRDKRTNATVDHRAFLSDPTTKTVFTGADLRDNCQARPDPQSSYWQVGFELRAEKREAFRAYTAQNVGKPLLIILNDEVLMYPTIKQAIGGSGVIEGNFTADEANQLAVFLNAGALPVPLDVVETQQVSATLGHESVNSSVTAGVFGVIAIFLFMVGYYRLPGLVACMALGIFILLVIASMVMIDATLTLYGIAGLILTVGMAVDANVLIFERLREELGAGKSMRVAMEAAFNRAWTAILDSNVTTILSGVALLMFGTGGIRGFAITLIVGVACSMLTAITITRLLLSVIVTGRVSATPWLFLGARKGN